jgi:hypothetical protein
VCQIARTGRRNSVPAASGVVRPVLTWCDLKHRTLKPASGAHRPVQNQNANLSAHESGGHRTRPVQHKERPVTPRRADITRAQGFLAAGSFPLRSLAAPASSPCPSAAAAVDSRPSAAPLESTLAPDLLRESTPFPLLASAFLSSKS